MSEAKRPKRATKKGATPKGRATPERKTTKVAKVAARNIGLQERDEHGPLEWIVPVLEAAYSRLAERGAEEAGSAFASPVALGLGVAPAASIPASSLQPSGSAEMTTTSPTDWRDALAEYRSRKAAVRPSAPAALVLPPMPIVPGGRNWAPLGPSVVLMGQTVGDNPVAGRVARIAIAPGGMIIYAASSNGGVFRSDDGATTWRSLMDGFDLDPTNFASASVVCGAIAIDAMNPNRVYVGTGEGDTDGLFRVRVTGALPSYRGIGPILSDDGGTTWTVEPTASGSPPLAGESFFALAVDPGNRENVLGATTKGLYQRVAKTGGGFEWVARKTGLFASVVMASTGGTTRFYASEWGKGVIHSSDGKTWGTSGTGFPATNVGRIALGVQAKNPNLVYALATTTSGAALGFYRLDAVTGAWTLVSGLPDILPGGQGSYDLAIAVDPADAGTVYLGGDRMGAPPYAGSIWRCTVTATGSGYKVTATSSIGTHAHADIHTLVHTPADPTELWCGCDGGVFLNRDPGGTGEFASQNNGLSCLCSNFIAQHPTDPNILLTGLQDNGTAMTKGGPIWTHVSGGDGGYCIINWANPDLVLVYANDTIYRSTTGAGSWAGAWKLPWVTMTQPMVCPPYNPANPPDADLVAIGAGLSVLLTEDFAATTPGTKRINLPVGSGNVFALAFATANRLFIGTTLGQVFRADRAAGAWALIRLDNAVGGPLGLVGLISDIAVDWADAALASVYVAFGGQGDPRHVWWHDGTRWASRSGIPGSGSNLLDVEHNALAVDQTAPNNVYVGADIGVWHSPDRGLTWQPLENGLPDAPIYDLQIHPTQRLLRAATHGRGLYEIELI